NTTSRSAPGTLSRCDSFSESQRAFVRCPIVEHARLWHEPQLLSTGSRPAPGGNRSATVVGAGEEADSFVPGWALSAAAGAAPGAGFCESEPGASAWLHASAIDPDTTKPTTKARELFTIV